MKENTISVFQMFVYYTNIFQKDSSEQKDSALLRLQDGAEMWENPKNCLPTVCRAVELAAFGGLVGTEDLRPHLRPTEFEAAF